jgi:hypothetical protein
MGTGNGWRWRRVGKRIRRFFVIFLYILCPYFVALFSALCCLFSCLFSSFSGYVGRCNRHVQYLQTRLQFGCLIATWIMVTSSDETETITSNKKTKPDVSKYGN